MSGSPSIGKAALVTGGATRLGREIALGLASQGANIALHYHSSKEQAERTAADIRALGRSCHCICADLVQPESAAKIFQEIQSALGHIDILINSAALFERGTLADTTPDLWDRQMAINLRAPFFLCRAFSAQTDQGAIINMADWRGERPDPDFLAYSLTKSALLTLTRGLAKSLAPGIRVNALALGAILPPAGASPDYLNKLKEKIPLRQTGSPADVVEAILFLLQSSYVTGEILHVTGGQHL